MKQLCLQGGSMMQEETKDILYYTVSAYAEKMKKSESWVYYQIATGKLKKRAAQGIPPHKIIGLGALNIMYVVEPGETHES